MKMKKFRVLLLCLILCISQLTMPVSAASVALSPQKVQVNGVRQSFEVYNISGNNYFKLRDIAYILNGTKAQFSVGWDSTNQVIAVTKGASYTAVGSEMTLGVDKSSTAKTSSQRLIIDGKATTLSAYNIGGNNFFKLREFGIALGFLVDFDSGLNSVIVDTESELARAIRNGFAPVSRPSDYNTAVTVSQFSGMLGSAIQRINPSKLSEWNKVAATALLSKEKMMREDGMLAVFYAASVLGEDYCTYNYFGPDLSNLIGSSVWDELSWNYSFFPDWKKPAKLGSDLWDNHMIAAYFYSMNRKSIYNDRTLFDFDSKSISMRPTDPFTYADALYAALRLSDSGLQPTDRIPTQEDVEILKHADERRNSILNSKTTVMVTGTSYYVSNSGNDKNNGLSPETAWATIAKINSMDFQAGDGIFFERGGMFRGVLRFMWDITFSAYGEGDKPKINGSPENGADPHKWALLEGTKNIWVFYKDMYDTGGIVFNDGKSWANRKTGVWDGSKYVEVIDKTTPIDVKKLDNLKFMCATDYTGYTTREAILELGKTGKLYLRCDAGNPGQIYDSIEFISTPDQIKNNGIAFIIQTGQNCVIDNLCLMYNACGISVDSNSTVQNCEVAWIGGCVAGFDGAGLGTDIITIITFGDGILVPQGSNSSIVNNYVHHLYDNAITVETGPWLSDENRFVKNVTIKGNLTEANSGGMMIGDWQALHSNTDNKLLFENIVIEDNYIMHSGYGWSHLEIDYNWGQAGAVNGGNCNIYFGFPAKAGKDIIVKNNVFYLSKYALVGGKNGRDGQKQSYHITFSGNTYVQNTGGILTEWASAEDFRYPIEYIFNYNSKKIITDLLGDKTCTVLDPY